MNGRTVLGLLSLLVLQAARAHAEPAAPDAGTVTARRAQPSFSLVQTLYGTTDLTRLSLRCHSVEQDKKSEGGADAKLHCAFFSLSIVQRPPEKLATFENYSEILRERTVQCRTATTRTEQARKACAVCANSPSDECLYVEAMKSLKRDCASPVRATTHENPAVNALREAEVEHGRDAASVTARFCAACVDDPTAKCFSSFWHGVATPARCTLVTSGYELELVRQGQTMAWTSNLADTCNTQVALSYDDQHRVWTLRQLALTPDKCAAGERINALSGTVARVYSSAAKYTFPELALSCERVTLAAPELEQKKR
jgi:hypothetical protein